MSLCSLYPMLMSMLMVTATVPRSASRTLRIDPSEDPFFDPYIETMLHMETKDIITMPKMNDDKFLQYLLSNNDDAYGVASRAGVDTSVFDPLRDAQLTNQPAIDQEWETLMISGPLAVNYIGNLMVLASKRDFSFQAPVGYNYRYIRYPDSFRATLAQVSSDMYNALMSAHTGMYQIQLAIQQVPTHVKTVMKLISSASDAMLKSVLPRTLESIGRVATESADTANSTLLRFNQLQDLLSEIIELSTNTQSTNEGDIERMKEQQQNSTLEQQRLQTTLEAIKNQYNESKASLENARKNYVDAMEKLSASATPDIVPDGNSKLDLLTTAIGLVFAPAMTIGCLLSQCGPPKHRVDNTKFENAMKIAQEAKEELQRAEQLHNEHFLLQLNEQNELAKTISKMAMLDLSVLSTEEIIRLLLEAVEQIHVIKEQWTHMIEFFSKLAAEARTTQQVIVKDFVDVIQGAQQDNILVNPYDREFFIELLVPSAMTIEHGAHLLFTMAKTYYAVSSKYMINQIAGIGKMLILQTDEARNTQLQQTSNNTLTTSLKVTQMAQERHTLYLQEIQNREAEYTDYINNLMISGLQGVVG